MSRQQRLKPRPLCIAQAMPPQSLIINAVSTAHSKAETTCQDLQDRHLAHCVGGRSPCAVIRGRGELLNRGLGYLGLRGIAFGSLVVVTCAELLPYPTVVSDLLLQSGCLGRIRRLGSVGRPCLAWARSSQP